MGLYLFIVQTLRDRCLKGKAYGLIKMGKKVVFVSFCTRDLESSVFGKVKWTRPTYYVVIFRVVVVVVVVVFVVF